MKNRLLGTTRPFENIFFCQIEGDGADGGDGAGEGGGGNEGGNGGGTQLIVRPETIPEKFWDPEKGVARVDDLAQAYTGLQSAYTRKVEDLRGEIDKERFAKRPEKAEAYDFKLPDTVDVPPGFELRLQPDSPLVEFWRKTAFDSGLGQEGFEAGVAEFAKYTIGQMPDQAAELAKMGENGEDRFNRVREWAAATLSDEEYGLLGALVSTAEGVGAMEKIMAKAGTPFTKTDLPRNDVDPLNNPQNQPAFDNETRRIQGEAAYQRGDPEAVAAVRARFKLAYPGEQEPDRNPSSRG
jgi:hypothetical protein